VDFWGYDDEGAALLVVMEIQPVRDVVSIDKPNVAPGVQRRGVRRALLAHLVASASAPIRVGTWPPSTGRSASTSATGSS
jgi:hypothetical protein